MPPPLPVGVAVAPELVPALDDPSIREWHKSFPAFGTGSVVSHVLLHADAGRWILGDPGTRTYFDTGIAVEYGRC